MQKYGRMMAVYGLTLVLVLCSGCVSDTPKQQPPCPNCTVIQTPLGGAADLHMKGFNAYINGNYATALDYYNKSLAADPKYTRAWIDKGNVLIKLNRTTEAVSAYDSALAIDGNVPEFWNMRGEVLLAAGNYTAARDSFNRALALAPDYNIAAENLNRTLAKMK